MRKISFIQAAKQKQETPFKKSPSCEPLCFQPLASVARRRPYKIKAPRTLVFFLNKIYVTYVQVIACEKLSKFLTYQMNYKHDE